MDPWMPPQLASIGLSIIVQGRNLFGERDESVHFAIVFLILTKFNFVHSGDESSIIQYGRKYWRFGSYQIKVTVLSFSGASCVLDVRKFSSVPLIRLDLIIKSTLDTCRQQWNICDEPVHRRRIGRGPTSIITRSSSRKTMDWRKRSSIVVTRAWMIWLSVLRRASFWNCLLCPLGQREFWKSGLWEGAQIFLSTDADILTGL